MKEIIQKLFNRKTCHQEDHETIRNLSERLCGASKVLRERENDLQRVARDAINFIGVFDPDKMTEFYQKHRNVLNKELLIIW